MERPIISKISDAPSKRSPLPAPTKIGEWSYAETIAAISRKLPAELLKQKTLKGQTITFLPWYRACNILDKYAPGWTYEVVNTAIATGTVKTAKDGHQELGGVDRLVLTVRLTLTFSDGVVSRDATGTEELSMSGYGDPASNAESMALRRAAAKFGLGRYLYEK